MSKKDYIAAAKIAAEFYMATDLSKWTTFNKEQKRVVMGMVAEAVEGAFVQFFKQDGGRFDEARFREACKG